MEILIMLMLAASMAVLFICGYYVGVIKEKYGKSMFFAIPITIAMLMFNIIWAITELVKTDRFH